MRTGVECLMDGLEKAGVQTIFGLPGGQVLDIFNGLYDAPFKFVLTRHEQGATHMADGYARATGRVGCCLVTSGPGATNTVTGLGTAYMDSIPLVCISGQVPTHMIGNDAFQEADTTGIIANDKKKPTVFSRWVSNNLTTGGIALSASVGHREGAAFNQAQYECLQKPTINRHDS